MKYYKNKLVSWILLFTLSFFFLSLINTHADERETLRIWAGLDFFASMLAADLEITNKKGDDGTLHLILMCKKKSKLFEEMALYFSKIGKIREIPIKVELITNNTFLNTYKKANLAGIFLTQRLKKDELKFLISYGKNNHIIIFSPFEGDIERGVTGGIFVSDRVLPYINLEAIRMSKIKIKEFFLKVAEKYE